MKRRSRVTLVLLTLALLAVIVVQGVWAGDPFAQDPAARLLDPSPAHPFGTDNFGRDILARLVVGARWSLAGAAVVCCGTSLLGFIIGALAASGNRISDNLIGRSIEALLAMPGLVMTLALSAVLGPSFENLLVAFIVTGWPGYARMYRALVLKERGQHYVEGAVALGAGQLRIVFRHILPNVIGPAAVLATGDFGKVILGLAALSFLGLGMQPPTPEWGEMINEARVYFQTHPWQMVAPGLCIILTVLAVNLLGDALRDGLDPRTIRR
jgi:ABC-type dipeptide/oligopeptide/nickel transport system permease subunit